jgi:hypothetical protein
MWLGHETMVKFFIQRWCLAPCVVGSWNHDQMSYTKVVLSTLCGWVMKPWSSVLYKRWCLTLCVVGSRNHSQVSYTKVVLSPLCGWVMKPWSNVLYKGGAQPLVWLGHENHGWMFYTKVMLSPLCGWVMKPWSNVLYKGGASHFVHHLPTIAQSTQRFIPLLIQQVVFNDRIDHHHHSVKDISFLPMATLQSTCVSLCVR